MSYLHGYVIVMTKSLGVEANCHTHTYLEGFASQQIGEANATPSDHTLAKSANPCSVTQLPESVRSKVVVVDVHHPKQWLRPPRSLTSVLAPSCHA